MRWFRHGVARVMPKLALLCILAGASACGDWAMAMPGADALGAPSDSSLLEPPILERISPAQGPTIGGLRLSIAGKNFVPGANLYIGGIAAREVTVWSGTLLTATLPANPGVVGNVPVEVRTPTGQGTSRSDLFAYFLSQLPFPLLNFQTTGTVTALAAGDFNGDQVPDLVAATAVGTAPGVALFLSNGLGGFSRTPLSATGKIPTAMATGDWNGDQKLDLAIAHRADNSVSLLFGKGDGSFAEIFRLKVGAGPSALAAGDWNGDHRLDLVVANGGANTVSLFLGKGEGLFYDPIPFATGIYPSAIVAEDWNRDQKLDLAITNNGSDNVSVLLNDGKGGFLPATDFKVGSAPSSIAMGDMDGDGLVDLAAGNTGSNNVTVLFGDGNGDFPATKTFDAGLTPSAVAFLDFNGDSKADLVLGSMNSSSRTSLLAGDGKGGFGLPILRRTYSTLGWAVGDFNLDKQLELVGASSDRLFMLVNDGKWNFSQEPSGFSGATSVSYPYPSIAVGDLNGDRRPDLVLPGAGNNVGVMLGDGTGGFLATSVFAGVSGLVTVGDWNGDQKLDIVVASITSGKLSALLGDGMGGFSIPIDSTGPFAAVGASIGVGDFIGDNLPDLATTSGSKIVVYQNLGKGKFEAVLPTIISTGHCVERMAVADFNRDNTLDIVTTCSNDNTVTLLSGKGNGMFLVGTPISLRIPSGFAVGDLNADQLPDLVVSSYDTGAYVLLNQADGVLLNPADGVFAKPFVLPAPPNPMADVDAEWVVLGDFNLDQKQDVLLGQSRSVVFWGDGRGGFTGSTGVFPRGTVGVVADANGDDKPDIISAHAGAYFVNMNSAH